MAHFPYSLCVLILVLQAVTLSTACVGSGSRSSRDPSADADTGPAPIMHATVPAAMKDADGSRSNPSTPSTQAPDDGGSTPGRLLIYSAITGHRPLDDAYAPKPSERYLTPAEREASRARSLEKEIADEMARQEQIDEQEAPPSAGGTTQPSAAASADPVAAPYAPDLRPLPDGLFSTDEAVIAPGQWQNPGELRLIRRSLDVDRDGQPEEIRYEDIRTGQVIRTEHDTNYDGNFDTWVSYEAGRPAIRVQDANSDGNGDSWERFLDGRAVAKTLDTNGDGIKDTFYRYKGDSLEQKLRDADDDGTIDRIDTYADRHLISSEEDQSLNGWMETWTTYEVSGDRDVVSKVERDTRDKGEPNVIEIYETRNGRTTLARQQEDLDGDGQADIVSTYEDGKLVQRAISNEALSPL